MFILCSNRRKIVSVLLIGIILIFAGGFHLHFGNDNYKVQSFVSRLKNYYYHYHFWLTVLGQPLNRFLASVLSSILVIKLTIVQIYLLSTRVYLAIKSFKETLLIPRLFQSKYFNTANGCCEI